MFISTVRRLLIGATFLASPISLWADSLTGRVLDPQGMAVPGAEVTLHDKASSGNVRKTTSSAAGEYDFQDLSAGAYLIDARTAEAAMTTSEEVAVAGATSKDLTLEVARSTIRVVVTATNSPLSEQEIAKVIDVVDLQDINLRDEYSISEALRNVPGVRVRQLEGPGSFTSIAVRGMRPSDTAVLVDGLRYRDAGSTAGDASAFFSDMNVIDTAGVEFLRGSGSSLYGTNAMAGVINITSGQGGGRTRGSIRAEGGGLGMMRGTANIGGGLLRDRFVYSGGISHLNVVNGIRGNYPHRNNGGQGFAKYKLTDKMAISGRVWGSDVFLRGSNSASFNPQVLANFPATGPVPAIGLPESQIRLVEQGLPFNAGNATFIPSYAIASQNRLSASFTGAMIFEHQLASNTSYRVSYQGVNTKRDYTSLNFLGSHSHYDGRTDLVQARLDSKVGFNLINVGYEFERENYLNLETGARPAPGDGVVDIDQQNHAFYGQDQMSLLDGKLQVALSGRIQTFALKQLTIAGQGNPYTGATFSNPGNAYTGDASVAYFFRSSQTKLRGHIGNSYRAPAPFERFGASYFQGSYGFYGDPRLKPERTIAFDTGIDQWLWNSKIRLGATFFYTDLRETIIFDFANFPQPDPFGRPGGYRNSNSGGVARGVELSSQFSLDAKTNIQFNYTFTNADQRTPTIGPAFYEIPWVSKNQLSATATRWITSRFNVTMDWFWAGEYSYSPFGANSRQLVFKGPNKTDFVANYTIPINDLRSVEVYGKLENAFNVRYFEGGNSTPGIWGIGGIKFNF